MNGEDVPATKEARRVVVGAKSDGEGLEMKWQTGCGNCFVWHKNDHHDPTRR